MASNASPSITADQIPLLTIQEFQCEHCGEAGSDGICGCPGESCPFIRRTAMPMGTRAPGSKTLLVSALVTFMIGAFFMVAGFSAAGIHILSNLLLALVFFLPAALLLLQGLRLLRGRWTLLYNPHNGAMARRLLLFNRTLRRYAISPVEPLHFPASPFDGQHYPISVAVLGDGETQGMRQFLGQEMPGGSIAEVYATTIVDLAARGLLTVWQAWSVTQHKADYLIVPGPARSSDPVSGLLERKLIRIVNHWPDYLVMDALRVNKHIGPNLFTLMYLTLANQATADDLTPVGQDTQPDMDPRLLQMMQEQAAAYAGQIERTNPDFVEAVQAQVHQALVALTYVAPDMVPGD